MEPMGPHMIQSSLLTAFRSELEKQAALSDKQQDYHRRKRFNRIHKILKNEGAETGAQMKRVIVNKKHLTKEDINKLHFKAVTVAVPEAGQSAVRTFRHPVTNHHIHEHGDSWVIHNDTKPSTTMLWEKDKLRRQGKLEGIKAPHWVPGQKSKKKKSDSAPPGRFDLAKSTIQGMPHLIGEGVPGMYHYLRGRVTGSSGMRDRVTQGLNPKTLKRMGKWKASHTFRDAHSAVTGASQPAHTQASAAMSGTPKEASIFEKLGAMTKSEQRKKRHAYYVANRQQMLQRGRAYRAQNRAEIRRKKVIYNRRVNTGVHRQRRRVSTGSFGASYQGYK
jgi:hypothetical protein